MGNIELIQDELINPANKHNLYYRLWKPSDATANMLLIHGFAEHGGRYSKLASAISNKGISVICPDLWGHGKSGGRRGDIEDFDQYLQDLLAIIEHLMPNKINNKLIIYGHSFGGLLAYNLALKATLHINSMVLESPLFGTGFRVPAWKKNLSKTLNYFFPKLALPLGLKAEMLSHDEEVVRSYKEDPLVHDSISLRCYAMLEEAMMESIGKSLYIKIPTLMMCAEKDGIVSVEKCKEVFEGLKCEKSMRLFEGSYHEIHNEHAFGQLLQVVFEWIHCHA